MKRKRTRQCSEALVSEAIPQRNADAYPFRLPGPLRIERAVTVKSYAEKLKDPRWQKKRLEILEKEDWQCWGCGGTEKTLHVHHLFYRKKTDPWDYPDEAYAVLCEGCHETRQALEQRFDELFRSKLQTAVLKQLVQGCENAGRKIVNECAVVAADLLMLPSAVSGLLDLKSEYIQQGREWGEWEGRRATLEKLGVKRETFEAVVASQELEKEGQSNA